MSNTEAKLYIIVFFFIAVGTLIMSFSNVKVEEHTVQSVERIDKVQGDSDSFSTHTYYLVQTNKGAYHIKTEGFNAAPQCASALKVGSTYQLKTRGIKCPFLGVYSKIVEIRKEI